MTAGLVIGLQALYMCFVVGLVFWMRNRWKKAHAESQHKISDAELFKLMTRTNHFITPDQLASTTSLTVKEAKARLMHLSTQRVLTRYYNNNQKTVYQLKEEVPLINSLRSDLNQLSDSDIIDIMLMHVDDYQVTIAELVVIFGIDIYEANNLIKRLKKSSQITVLRKGVERIYAIKKPIQLTTPNLRTTPKKKDLEQLSIDNLTKMKIPDADVIQLAIKNNGKLTPTLLCLKKQIPIHEAKIKLESLYEQGAFVIDVDEENYVMEYHLTDKTLL